METAPAIDAPAFDPTTDHFAGSPDASHVLIEYGSYACRHCRAAQGVIERVREHLGDDVVYVFRHKPLKSDPYAVPSASFAEALAREGRYFEAHEALMSTPVRSRGDLEKIAANLGVSKQNLDRWLGDEELKAQVEESAAEVERGGVKMTPTFIIDGKHYTGAWDEMSLLEALDEPVAHRVSRSAQAFAGWAPGTGLLLAAAAVVALVLANSPLAPSYRGFWETTLALEAGSWRFGMSVGHWVNDALMAVFFLVVGLEIKREVTIGTLSDPRDAALPAAAAIGGMAFPAAIYLSFNAGGNEMSGWGIPMATDIAFAVGLLSLLGRRVPLRLKVFLTALAIVDDLGAIVVIALFYGHGFDVTYGLLALGCLAALIGLNLSGVYSALPYALAGAVLWYAVYSSGLHATLAGILLAMTVPTRPPPNLRGLLAQAQAVIRPEALKLSRSSDRYPERRVIKALDAVHARIESPAHRIERLLEPWSSFLILPLFALANAGVVLTGGSLDFSVMLGIGLGLVVGKPLGVAVAALLVTRLNLATWPSDMTMGSLVGIGALAGIGFTMSLFIANEAFSAPTLTDNAKLAVLAASALAAAIGLVLLHRSLPQIGACSNADDSE